MKRLTALLLAFIVLLALAACGGGGNSSYENSGVGAISGDIRAFAQRDSNFCATGDTVYFARKKGNGYIIYYVDKATWIGGPLCGKPECLHNDGYCNAYGGAFIYALTVYNGRLYWIDDNIGIFFLYSAALDGTDRKLVRELDSDTVGTSRTMALFQIHDDVLYFASSPVGSRTEK